jgi:hypothetical protein
MNGSRSGRSFNERPISAFTDLGIDFANVFLPIGYFLHAPFETYLTKASFRVEFSGVKVTFAGHLSGRH